MPSLLDDQAARERLLRVLAAATFRIFFQAKEAAMRGLCATSLAAVLVIAGPALARPIRTNEPGTGVFIGSGLLGQVITNRESNGDARLWDVTGVVDLRYTPATHWVFAARVPYTLARSLDARVEGGQSVTDSTNGLGDVMLSVKHRFYRTVGPWFDRHAAVEVGVELPTGETNNQTDPRLPVHLQRRLQPGSGSTDLFFDFIVQQGQRRFIYGADASYRLNTEGDGRYRFGDEVRVNLDVEYILLPWVYKRPGKEVFTLLEATFVHKQEDEFRDAGIRETRRTEVLLAPGLQYVATEQLLFSASVQLPAWSDAGGDGLETDYNVLAEFRFAF